MIYGGIGERTGSRVGVIASVRIGVSKVLGLQWNKGFSGNKVSVGSGVSVGMVVLVGVYAGTRMFK